jgi:hypothetical protein
VKLSILLKVAAPECYFSKEDCAHFVTFRPVKRKDFYLSFHMLFVNAKALSVNFYFSVILRGEFKKFDANP